MLKSKNLQFAIMMISLFGWPTLLVEETAEGRTISNDDENCYVTIPEDEFTWLNENYPGYKNTTATEALAGDATHAAE